MVAKASQHDLQKKLRGWERKAEIASMQAQRMRKMWRKMQEETVECKERLQNIHKKVPHLPHLPQIDKMKITSC